MKPSSSSSSSKQRGGPKGPLYTRGLYAGEARVSPEGYKIDTGRQYLLRTGYEPSAVPIGFSPLDFAAEGRLLEGVHNDLVRRAANGVYVPVHPSSLGGLSVALLFSAGTHPKCTSFIPFLVQFYQTVNTAGGHPKIEVIYIGLDGEAAEFEDSRQRMPWLSLQYNSPLRHKLIKRYRLKIEPAGPPVEPHRASMGIPRLLVVGPYGEQIHSLCCEHQSAVIFKEWDFIATAWPPSLPCSSSSSSSSSSGVDAAAATENANQHQQQQQQQQQADPLSWPFTPEQAEAIVKAREQHH